MGFMGWNSIGASDTAWDFAFDIGTIVAKRIRKELESGDAGPYNTSGAYNAALVIRELVFPKPPETIFDGGEFFDVVKDTLYEIEATYDRIKDRKDCDEQINCYEELVEQLTQCVEILAPNPCHSDK